MRAGSLLASEPLSSLAITTMVRLFLSIVERKEAAMATPNGKSISVLNSLRTFLKNTITAFGLVVIMKAVMAPHALGYSA